MLAGLSAHKSRHSDLILSGLYLIGPTLWLCFVWALFPLKSLPYASGNSFVPSLACPTAQPSASSSCILRDFVWWVSTLQRAFPLHLQFFPEKTKHLLLFSSRESRSPENMAPCNSLFDAKAPQNKCDWRTFSPGAAPHICPLSDAIFSTSQKSKIKIAWFS